MNTKYNSDEWKEVEIELEPFGKTTKKYGENVYRFSAAMTLSVILPRRGWTLIKGGKTYAYLRPPEQQAHPPFSIKIKIPSKEQAIEIANECFSAGESWLGQIGEWPAYYQHKEQQKSYEIVRAENGKGYIEKLDHVFPVRSSLYIGQHGVWLIQLIKEEDCDFTFVEYGNVKDRPKNNEIISPALREGQALEVEQTEYERNPLARRKCIEHHGVACQVCGFHFGENYGSIGEGFIHVHHIKPISMQGGQYEVNPITDLIPLCPNCHAMAHRRNPPYTIDELKTIRK